MLRNNTAKNKKKKRKSNNSNNFKNKRYKFANRADVPADAEIRSEGNGATSRHFVINPDGSETQVYRPNTLSTRRFQYQNRSDIPLNASIRSEGRGNNRKYFAKNPDGSETQVYRARTLSARRFQYPDDRGDVPSDAEIRSEGNGATSRHFVKNPNGSETQVYMVETLARLRLKNLDGSSKNQVNTTKTLTFQYEDRNDVPPSASIRSEGSRNHRKYFAKNPDGSETQVYRPSTLSARRLKYFNEDDVPMDANILSEGCGRSSRHFVINPDGSKTQVYTVKTLALMRRLKDLERSSEAQVNTTKTLTFQYEDRSDVILGVPTTRQEEWGNNSNINSDGSEPQVYMAKIPSKRRPIVLENTDEVFNYEDSNQMPLLQIVPKLNTVDENNQVNEKGNSFFSSVITLFNPIFKPNSNDGKQIVSSAESNKTDYRDNSSHEILSDASSNTDVVFSNVEAKNSWINIEPEDKNDWMNIKLLEDEVDAMSSNSEAALSNVESEKNEQPNIEPENENSWINMESENENENDWIFKVTR